MGGPTTADIQKLRSAIKYLMGDYLDPFEFNDAYHTFVQWTTKRGITRLLDKLEAAEAKLEMTKEALKLLFSWVENWDSPFLDDPEWRECDGPKIRAIIKEQSK